MPSGPPAANPEGYRRGPRGGGGECIGRKKRTVSQGGIKTHRRGGIDLKKVMLLAAMLAMVLAAAAPALSQTAAGGDVAILQYSCDQIQAAVNVQYQQGEGTGAVAGAAQALGVDQQQVLACFGTAAALQDSTVNVGGDDGTVKATAKHTAKAAKATAKATATHTAKATA